MAGPIVMPGIRYEPLSSVQGQRLMTAHDIFCVHTMVGSFEGTDDYFDADGWKGPESHFGTGGLKGQSIQWQDLRYSADANLDGWHNVISQENADMGAPFAKWNTNDGSAVPAFTADQCEIIAQQMAWACSKAAHKNCPTSWNCYKVGIPLQLIPDTKPGRRGVGYHAQGVPGNGLVLGGVAWSSARGKVCPGWRRIAQIPGIIKRAIEISAGVPLVTVPTPLKELDMYTIRRVEDGAIALVAPGNFRHLNGEEAGVLLKVEALSKPLPVNAREWDVTANAMQGNGFTNSGLSASIASEVRNLLLDPTLGLFKQVGDLKTALAKTQEG